MSVQYVLSDLIRIGAEKAESWMRRVKGGVRILTGGSIQRRGPMLELTGKLPS